MLSFEGEDCSPGVLGSELDIAIKASRSSPLEPLELKLCAVCLLYFLGDGNCRPDFIFCTPVFLDPSDLLASLTCAQMSLQFAAAT